ncbi:MAG: ribosome maturation factor RimP [Lysobacteraceae bacterium]|nr:MAG: ribosome maturation factor RimP [Xanthomonadaceae bacterium]
MAKLDQLNALIEPLVEDLGYELVGIDYRPGGDGLLRIYIDQSEVGIRLEDCEKVSREVSALMDVEDPIGDNYMLEVSSPGLNRPLFKLEHYATYKGHEAKINLIRPLDGRRRFRGLIEAVGEQTVSLLMDGEVYELPFGDIAKANLVAKL